jgi:hypothetical protein
MSSLNLVVRNGRNTLQSCEMHGSTAITLIQHEGVESKYFEDYMRLHSDVEVKVVPIDSGIIVIDFITRQILSMQGYFNLYHEYYGKDAVIKSDRKIIRVNDFGTTTTDSPLVNKLVENSWNIIDYQEGEYGFGLAMPWFISDLKELGISITENGWWDYFMGHYAWANIPSKKLYVGNTGRLKAFKGLTKEQKKLLEVLNTIKGDDYVISMKLYETHDLIMRNLDSKYCIKMMGGGGGTFSGKMTYKYKITV